ncbi:hypothetical protein EXIGLDRAFT_841009 [Exidia glandulosa HHB12029]|uniref:Uncharacterized protein n=1 Tax=Exidia glandulosa HHB12029 TaxID=1314781 RepID=A0A165E5F6_EXIGL|nr:hypothetical protein EXIGLDRAFT_841009 [Exidia glandulosa HHB12029]
MPPRRSARAKAPATQTATRTNDYAITYPSPSPAHIPPLASLAPELLDMILSHLRSLPLTLNYKTLYGAGIPSLASEPCNYTERTDALRALSGTCRALRRVCHVRLWRRVDFVFVPEGKTGTWYKYAMAALERKSVGLRASPGLMAYIRTISFTITASRSEEMIAALASLLPELSNLQTIHVLGCNQPGKLGAAMKELSLDSVRMLAVDSDAHALVKCSPNATHVRCTGSSNHALLSALASCPNIERFDGMFDWRDKKAAQKLVKSAPNLQRLEIRHPAVRGLGIFSQDNAPYSEWLSNLLPDLARLEKLATLELSFPVPTRRDPKRAEELRKGYDKVVEQARKIMVTRRKVDGRRRLVVRHVEAPHYDNEVDHIEDLVFEYNVEVFE